MALLDIETIQEKLTSLACALDLNKSPVGVRLLYTQEEYETTEAEPLKGAFPYCMMVKFATKGRHFKVKAENFRCSGGAKALGMIPLNLDATSGQNYLRLGLCQDLPTARTFQENLSMLPYPVYGIEIGGLASFTALPHIAIFVTDAYNAMRLLQGYSHKYGLKGDYKLAGSQALCVESTAHPYLINGINLSLMCSGTRFWCGWDRSDMAVGMAVNLLADVIDGVLATCDHVEPLQGKLQILHRCESENVDIPLDLYHSYYYTYSETHVENAKRSEKKSDNIML